MDETVLGIIAPTEGKGKGGVRWGGTIKRFALIFTPTSVIMIKLAGFLKNLAGAVGQLFDQTGVVSRLFDRSVRKKLSELTGQSLDELLQSDKDNYVIPYAEIVKVEMKKGGFISDPNIWISTKTEKHIFVILKKEHYKSGVDIVSAALPNKVSIS